MMGGEKQKQRCQVKGLEWHRILHQEVICKYTNKVKHTRHACIPDKVGMPDWSRGG